MSALGSVHRSEQKSAHGTLAPLWRQLPMTPSWPGSRLKHRTHTLTFTTPLCHFSRSHTVFISEIMCLDVFGTWPIWRFPKMGGTSKSSVLDWDSRSSTIHDGVSPVMETSISPNGPNVHQKIAGHSSAWYQTSVKLIGFVGKNYRKIPWSLWENRWFPVKIFP